MSLAAVFGRAVNCVQGIYSIRCEALLIIACAGIFSGVYTAELAFKMLGLFDLNEV
jgi:uncharacterized membrane protein YiaA